MPHAKLKDEWLRITHHSYVVDVRMIRSDRDLAKYVTKYLSQPIDKLVIGDFNALCEAILAMNGRKLCRVYGDWQHAALTDFDSDAEWEPVAPLHEIIIRARAGDTFALAVMDALKRDPVTTEPRPRHDLPPPDPLLWDQP